MRKNDWILIGSILVIACVLGVFIYQNSLKEHRGNYVVVTVDKEEYGRYELNQDQMIKINDTNQLEIKDGEAAMIYADCPDKLCVHMASISKAHEMIVCLPNKVTVEAFEK